jgi:hypothetical protein
MGRHKKQQTIMVLNDQDELVETSDVGVPGLFTPGQWDIDEEFQNNEALREHRKEQSESF